ncbi:MAG: cupin domain-containing protein [Gammaproteobacteria bacterium]|nr:cupin domain-containing protein [Gammaproteobacteria bacterium]NNJ91177.1 cupin domain-containing protein [Gammaproteobacteria bacterium]
MIKNNHDTKEYFFQEGCYITEFWNENSDEQVSVAQARLAAGETTKPHALKNTIERYLIVAGEGVVYIGENPPQSVSKDDVVYIPASTSQSIKNTGDTELVFLAICTPRFKEGNYISLGE